MTMTTDAKLRISQRAIRFAAIGTLLGLALSAVSDKYYPEFSHVAANTIPGSIFVSMIMISSLILPVCVGAVAWHFKRTKALYTGLWVDVALSLSCVALFSLLVLWAIMRYAMF